MGREGVGVWVSRMQQVSRGRRWWIIGVVVARILAGRLLLSLMVVIVVVLLEPRLLRLLLELTLSPHVVNLCRR